MKGTSDILQVLGRVKPVLGEKYGVRAIALFGSCARGDQNEKSDVDVLVDVDSSIGLDFVDLADAIEDVIGAPTDVVSMRGIKPRYLKSIEKDLIYV